MDRWAISSDWHLGGGRDHRGLVTAWISRWAGAVSEGLVLAGDLAEMQLASHEVGMRSLAPMLWQAVTETARAGVRLVILAGNHDERMGELLASAWAHIEVYDRSHLPRPLCPRASEADHDGPVWVTHGDQWDPSIWWYDFLDRVQWAGRGVIGRWARKIGGRIDGASERALKKHRERAEAWLMQMPAGSTVVHGHTHVPQIIELPGDRTLVDVGSGVRGGLDAAIQGADGEWRLERWT